MASIFNLWRDEDPTEEDLFSGIADPIKEEEKRIQEEKRKKEEERLAREKSLEPSRLATLAMGTAAGPVGVKVESSEMGGTGFNATEKFLKETIGIESPRSLSVEEQQKAIKDFFAEKAPINEEFIIKEGKEYQEKATSPEAFQAMEEGSEKAFADIEQQELTKKQALDARLDAKLNEVKSQFEVATKGNELRSKFGEIESRRNKSIRSIEKAELDIVANPNYAGSPRGNYELNKLAQQKKEIMEQSIADQKKLGLSAWEAMPSDAKLVYTRMSQTGEVSPKDAIAYTSLNNEITKGTQSLMLDLQQMGVDKNRINEIDDYIYGKKQIVNGQIQVDENNEPVRVGKGLAFKNKFGIYEPSVDLKTFENGLKNIAKQYTEANVGGTRGGEQESNQYKMAAEFLKDVKVLEDIEKDKFEQVKGTTEGYTLTKSFEEGITTEEDKKRIDDLKAAATETTKYGGALDKEERAKRQQKESETQVNSMLRELQANPTRQGLENAFDQGLVRTYEVVDNKLVDTTSGPVQNDEFVIIVDPDERIGGQLVNIGKDKIKEFEEDANNLFYVNGQLTRNAPSWVGNIFAGSETRNKALGIGTSKFNKFLEEARNIKLQSEESIKAKEKKEKEKPKF